MAITRNSKHFEVRTLNLDQSRPPTVGLAVLGRLIVIMENSFNTTDGS